MSAPCEVQHQIELINDLQKKETKLKFLDINESPVIENSPMLIAKRLSSYSGKDLHSLFDFWCDEFKFKKTSESILKLKPKSLLEWTEVKIEKKIALFSQVMISSSSMSYLFLEDLHLQKNAQEYLINSLKNIVSESGNALFLFWSFHQQIAKTQSFYFKGFKPNA
jgi:hypothetical protein